MRSTVYNYRLVEFHNDGPGYYLGTIRLLRPRGVGGGGGWRGVQFSKRLDFGGSILKMHKT